MLDLSGLTGEERAFLDRCAAAYRDGVTWVTLSRLVEGAENPLVRAEGGRITRSAWDHPLFQAISDLEDRLGVAQGYLEPDPGDDPDRDPFTDERIQAADMPRR